MNRNLIKTLKETRRKWLASLLALCMVLSMTPIPAFTVANTSSGNETIAPGGMLEIYSIQSKDN